MVVLVYRWIGNFIVFSGMYPLSLRQKEAGENCRKLTVTLQKVLYYISRMRSSVGNLTFFFFFRYNLYLLLLPTKFELDQLIS